MSGGPFKSEEETKADAESRPSTDFCIVKSTDGSFWILESGDS